MKCPICPDADLVMTERQGVEIDYCPKCRGVWLDRGELDKIIERSTSGAAEVPIRGTPVAGQPSAYGYPSGHHDHDKHHGHYRRKSWLGELFD